MALPFNYYFRGSKRWAATSNIVCYNVERSIVFAAEFHRKVNVCAGALKRQDVVFVQLECVPLTLHALCSTEQVVVYGAVRTIEHDLDLVRDCLCPNLLFRHY